MKKVLLTLLVVILILGALGAVGYAGYQYGYRQGVLTTASNGEVQNAPRGGNFGPQGMPMHNFGFDHGFNRGYGMFDRGMGFGFFPPLFFLAQILFWGLIIWGIYMLVKRSGWRLTKTESKVETTPPAVILENKES